MWPTTRSSPASSPSSSFSSSAMHLSRADKENTPPPPPTPSSSSTLATPGPRRKALLSEVIAQSRTPQHVAATPKPLPPRTPASALKSILRQADTPSSSSSMSQSQGNSSRGVEWGYRMTDRGDVSKISDTTAGSSRSAAKDQLDASMTSSRGDGEQDDASSSRLSLSRATSSATSTRPPPPAAPAFDTSASTDLSLSLSNTGAGLLSMDGSVQRDMLHHPFDSSTDSSLLGKTPRAKKVQMHPRVSMSSPSATPRAPVARQPLLPLAKQSPGSSYAASSSPSAHAASSPTPSHPAPPPPPPSLPRQRLSTGQTMSSASSSLSLADMSSVSSMASLNDSFFRREGEKLREAFARGEDGIEGENLQEEQQSVEAEAEEQQESLRVDHSEATETSSKEEVDEEQYEEEQGEEEEEGKHQSGTAESLHRADDPETSAVSSGNTSSHRSILDSPTVKVTSASPRRSSELDEAQETRDTSIAAANYPASDVSAQEASMEHSASPAPSSPSTSSPAQAQQKRTDSLTVGVTASPSADKLRRLALGRASVERLRGAGGDSPIVKSPRAPVTKGRSSAASTASAASSEFVSFATAGQAVEAGEEVREDEPDDQAQEAQRDSPALVVASPKMKDKALRSLAKQNAATPLRSEIAATPSPLRRPASAMGSPTQQQWPATPASSRSLPPQGSPSFLATSGSDAQTRLVAVRHALDEYLFAHSSRLSTLSVRLTSSLSEASLLRDVLAAELEGKSNLLRELAAVKWELEERVRDKDNVLEEWASERREAERRDGELRRLVERMREQVERRVGSSSHVVAEDGGDEEIVRLQEELVREKELREQQRRDYEVRLLAIRATSASPAQSREASPSAATPSLEEGIRLARESMERDHEVRVYAMQRDHEEALEALEEQLLEAQRERDEAMQGQGQGAEELEQQLGEVERERDEARQERDEAQQERDEAWSERDAAKQELAEHDEGRQQDVRELDELRAANEDLVSRLESLLQEQEGREDAHQAAIAELDKQHAEAHQEDAAKMDQLHAVAQQMEREREELLEAVSEIERTVVVPQEERITQLERQLHEHQQEAKQHRSDSTSAFDLERRELRARCDELDRQVGDRGLTISKLQRQNEKLEVEIQNHAMALVAKQEELALLKRKVRKAGLATPGATPMTAETQRYEVAGSSYTKDDVPEEMLERGPAPAKARGRRTMDVAARMPLRSAVAANAQLSEDNVVEEDATPKTRRIAPASAKATKAAPRQSTALRPSHRRTNSQASSVSQGEEQEQQRVSLSSTGSSSSASLQKRTTRSSVSSATDFAALPRVPTHPLGEDEVDRQTEEPMSFTGVTANRQSLSLSRPSLPASSTRRPTVGRASSTSSRSSVSSTASSTTSSRLSISGGASLSKMPGMESFLAKRRAAGEAVARMTAMSANGTPGRSRGWEEEEEYEQENAMPAM